MRRPALAMKRPSGLLVWPSKLVSSVTIGHGGGLGSESCHFFAYALSPSEVGRNPQPVRSFPLNRLTKPGSGVNSYGALSSRPSVAKTGRKAPAHFAYPAIFG